MVLSARYRFLPRRYAFVLIGVAVFGWATAETPERAAGVLSAQSARLPQSLGKPSDTTSLRRAALVGPYPVEILRVLDGDTFEAKVRIWFGQEITTLVRVRGIDAPELKGLCGDELKGAAGARDALAKLLASGLPLLRDVGLDKYAGRVVASVDLRGPSAIANDVSTWMISSGWARPYSGGRRDSWCALPTPGRG